MTARLELKLGALRDGLEILRLHWLGVCQWKCSPPAEDDIDKAQAHLADLRAMLLGAGPLSDDLRAALGYLGALRLLIEAQRAGALADPDAIEREISRAEACVSRVLGAVVG